MKTTTIHTTTQKEHQTVTTTCRLLMVFVLVGSRVKEYSNLWREKTRWRINSSAMTSNDVLLLSYIKRTNSCDLSVYNTCVLKITVDILHMIMLLHVSFMRRKHWSSLQIQVFVISWRVIRYILITFLSYFNSISITFKKRFIKNQLFIRIIMITYHLFW